MQAVNNGTLDNISLRLMTLYNQLDVLVKGKSKDTKLATIIFGAPAISLWTQLYALTEKVREASISGYKAITPYDHPFHRDTFESYGKAFANFHDVTSLLENEIQKDYFLKEGEEYGFFKEGIAGTFYPLPEDEKLKIYKKEPGVFGPEVKEGFGLRNFVTRHYIKWDKDENGTKIKPHMYFRFYEVERNTLRIISVSDYDHLSNPRATREGYDLESPLVRSRNPQLYEFFQKTYVEPMARVQAHMNYELNEVTPNEPLIMKFSKESGSMGREMSFVKRNH
ncbi:MAG: hypothetical protein HQK52_08875 [Oligoflexia bacterium]|nr:hypothetical protein [Oligoflexia bacterium]